MYVLFLPLLALTAWCGVQLHHSALERTALKDDFSQVNSIKFGLLSVNLWRDRIQAIVSRSIGEFEFTSTQEEDLRVIISNVLQALVKETHQMMKQRRHTLAGKIQRMVVTTFLDSATLRKKVPALTQTIIDEIKKPKNKDKLKHFAQTQLDSYAAQSYDNESDLATLQALLSRHGAESPGAFNRLVRESLPALDHRINLYCGAMLGLLAIFLVMGGRLWRHPALRQTLYTFGIGFALVFLLTGVTTPMMEIDARINKVDVVLVGQHVLFEDQVLFYRSKSILQVVLTMLDTREGGSIVVGVLILIFSIIFPLAKLISSQWILMGGPRARANAWLHFFAFKSGKWSMADVMVVALFMAFIGFSSILRNQLEGFNFKTEHLECIATSGTSLRPGLLIFVGFVLYGLFLSSLLDHAARPPVTPLNALRALPVSPAAPQ